MRCALPVVPKAGGVQECGQEWDGHHWSLDGTALPLCRAHTRDMRDSYRDLRAMPEDEWTALLVHGS